MDLGISDLGGSSSQVSYGGASDNLAAAIFISGGGQSDLSHENGPTLYTEPNRTSATEDIRTIIIYILIATVLFTFLVILPGLRSEKLPTFLCIATSLVVTSIIIIAVLGTTWHVAEAPISAAYKAFSQDRIQGHLGVRIGLQSVNITLVIHDLDVNYNERFYWIEPNQMREEHYSALKRGLPYPILTVAEYLAQDEAGFNWSRQYRAAGYYTTIGLWLSMCLSALMFALHCAVPKYGVYAMQALGCLLLLTCSTYASLVPKGERALVIPFEGQALTFRFGWNFWFVLAGGGLSALVGTIIVIIDKLLPNFIFTTVLDAEFDSHHNKDKVLKRSPQGRLEEPPPFMKHARAFSARRRTKTFGK